MDSDRDQDKREVMDVEGEAEPTVILSQADDGATESSVISTVFDPEEDEVPVVIAEESETFGALAPEAETEGVEAFLSGTGADGLPSVQDPTSHSAELEDADTLQRTDVYEGGSHTAELDTTMRAFGETGTLGDGSDPMEDVELLAQHPDFAETEAVPSEYDTEDPLEDITEDLAGDSDEALYGAVHSDTGAPAAQPGRRAVRGTRPRCRRRVWAVGAGVAAMIAAGVFFWPQWGDYVMALTRDQDAIVAVPVRTMAPADAAERVAAVPALEPDATDVADVTEPGRGLPAEAAARQSAASDPEAGAYRRTWGAVLALSLGVPADDGGEGIK